MPASELNINEGATAIEMAETIFGSGVTVVSASYTGWSQSSGTYSGGDATSPGVTPGDTGVILSTGRASDFTNSSGEENQNTNTSTNTPGPSNSPDFNAQAGASTFDASWIDVTFIPTGDTMTMQFVFSSEEYPEFVNSIYNDFVGVWVNGSFVPMVVGDGTTSVGNINGNENINLYESNVNDDFNTEMDGFTLTMTLTIPVNDGVANDIRIGIADVGDSNFDSNLLIAGDSVQTELIANSDELTMFANKTKNLDVLGNDDNTAGGVITITHINGVAVVAGDSVTLSTGQTVTLLADGTFDVTSDADLETINFTYGIENTNGETDTGYVTVNTIPCFVAGTHIRTPDGEVLVEDLRVGDLVDTIDNGAQPIRWIGTRVVAAEGDLAPVRFQPGAFGAHQMLELSPQHRLLLRDEMAEMLFGETEVLVAAKELVNDMTIRFRTGGDVQYFHLMFDQHEIIWSGGLATESYLPGDQTHKMFDPEALAELSFLFPTLDVETGEGYSAAARRILRSYEAKALIGAPRLN